MDVFIVINWALLGMRIWEWGYYLFIVQIIGLDTACHNHGHGNFPLSWKPFIGHWTFNQLYASGYLWRTTCFGQKLGKFCDKLRSALTKISRLVAKYEKLAILFQNLGHAILHPTHHKIADSYRYRIPVKVVNLISKTGWAENQELSIVLHTKSKQVKVRQIVVWLSSKRPHLNISN